MKITLFPVTPLFLSKNLPCLRNFALNSSYFSASHGDSLTGAEIVESVSFLNENFDILNIAKFGDLSTVKTVLVIQVSQILKIW